MRRYRDLGLLNGFRWQVNSGERERSSCHGLAGETRQTVQHRNDSLYVLDQRAPDVLRLLQEESRGSINAFLLLERAFGRAHTFAYHKIGHWIMNMLALVACQLDKN